jgi:hypothetical protein
MIAALIFEQDCDGVAALQAQAAQQMRALVGSLVELPISDHFAIRHDGISDAVGIARGMDSRMHCSSICKMVRASSK